MLKDILEEMKKIRESGLVHADLSEYNILVKDSKPVIIDVGQAVLQTHPRAKEFLERDLKNISTFFRKKGVKDIDEVFEQWNM